MAVMARESWTDERLDDLKGQMNQRFDHVDAEMNQRFDQVDQRFGRVETTMKEGFARVDGDIRELRGDIKETQRLMIHGFIGICTLMGTGFSIMIAGIGILAF
jgi:hypothetical protein